MVDARVSDIRGLNLAVRDLAASVAFYSKLWGLEEVARENGTVYLRATGAEHHALALHEGPHIELRAANYAAPDKTAVDALHAKAVAFGAKVEDAPHALPSGRRRLWLQLSHAGRHQADNQQRRGASRR